MAYNPLPTLSTGDTWSAANANIYWKDNFAAGVPDIFTAAGDIAYATAANAASPLAIGTAGQVLKVNTGGTLPEWGVAGNVTDRQGASSSDWVSSLASSSYASSDNYSITSSKMEVGVVTATISNGASAIDSVITFPTAFSENPIILTNVINGSVTYDEQSFPNTITPTTFQIKLCLSTPSSGDTTRVISWIAIGTP
jgi:hypothetical protein